MSSLPNSPVCIVATGGTFDKSYDPVSETMGFNEPSCIPGVLGECLVRDFTFNQIMQIDSLAMVDETRMDIANFVKGAKFDRFVIVHGTSSMLETGKVFQRLKLAGTFVFTGAMTPFRYSAVEASFNLGGAVALARYLPHGVYVYMHGRTYDPSRAEKDRLTPRFVEIDDV